MVHIKPNKSMINTISEYIKKKRKKEAEETEIRDQRALQSKVACHMHLPTTSRTMTDWLLQGTVAMVLTSAVVITKW